MLTQNQPGQQTYSAISSEARQLGQAFFDEAQRLIPKGAELTTLTAVAALQLLCIAASGFGLDRLGLEFLCKSVQVGIDMGLFGVETELESASTWLDNMGDWNSAASYTAWGVYNWVSFVNPKTLLLRYMRH